MLRAKLPGGPRCHSSRDTLNEAPHAARTSRPCSFFSCTPRWLLHLRNRALSSTFHICELQATRAKWLHTALCLSLKSRGGDPGPTWVRCPRLHPPGHQQHCGRAPERSHRCWSSHRSDVGGALQALQLTCPEEQAAVLCSHPRGRGDRSRQGDQQAGVNASRGSQTELSNHGRLRYQGRGGDERAPESWGSQQRGRSGQAVPVRAWPQGPPRAVCLPWLHPPTKRDVRTQQVTPSKSVHLDFVCGQSPVLWLIYFCNLWH